MTGDGARTGIAAALIGILLSAAMPVLAKAVPHKSAAVNTAIGPASALLVRQTSPELTWRWRAAPEAATAPGLLRAIRATGLAEAGKARADARRDAASAKKAGFPFRRHTLVDDWSLAADTPHLLALAHESYSDTGGAHGNTAYDVKIWDKRSNRAISLPDLFSDWPHARKLLSPAFCAALAAERGQRRNGQTLGGDFDACPKLAEQPLLPWGGIGSRAPQLRVLLAPYIAGPYSEGGYLVTLPWPEAVKPLVKPTYRDDLFGTPD